MSPRHPAKNDRLRLGPDWESEPRPTVDDPGEWRVDALAPRLAEAASEAKPKRRALSVAQYKVALRRIVILLRDDVVRHTEETCVGDLAKKKAVGGRSPKDDFCRRLEQAEKALRELGEFGFTLAHPEIGERWWNTDVDLLAEMGHLRKVMEAVNELPDKLASMRSRLEARHLSKSDLDPLWYAIDETFLNLRYLLDKIGLPDGEHMRVFEAVWLDAGLEPKGNHPKKRSDLSGEPETSRSAAKVPAFRWPLIDAETIQILVLNERWLPRSAWLD